MKAWRNLATLPRELWILCLAQFVNRVGTMVGPFLVLYLTRSVGLSAERAAAMLLVYGIVGLLTSPAAGWLADRVGRLWIMEASLISFGTIVLLYPLARSGAAVLVMTIIFSAANEGFRPASLAVVGDLGDGPHRKSAFTLYRLASNLGVSVGPALGGVLVQSSFRLLFIVDGLTTLAAAAILILSPFHRLMKARDVESRQRRGDAPKGTRWPLAALRDDAALRVFALAVLPVLMVFWQLQSALPLFLIRDLGFAAAAYGLLFTVNTLMIVAIEVPLTAALAHWPHRRALVVGSCLFAVGFGSLAVARSYIAVVGTVVVWTFGEMILFPAMSAYVSGIAPQDRQGEYMGLYTMTFSLAFLMGPWLGTLALERFGATTLWSGAFVMGSVSAVALAFAQTVRRERPLGEALEDLNEP